MTNVSGSSLQRWAMMAMVIGSLLTIVGLAGCYAVFSGVKSVREEYQRDMRHRSSYGPRTEDAWEERGSQLESYTAFGPVAILFSLLGPLAVIAGVVVYVVTSRQRVADLGEADVVAEVVEPS